MSKEEKQARADVPAAQDAADAKADGGKTPAKARPKKADAKKAGAKKADAKAKPSKVDAKTDDDGAKAKPTKANAAKPTKANAAKPTKATAEKADAKKAAAKAKRDAKKAAAEARTDAIEGAAEASDDTGESGNDAAERSGPADEGNDNAGDGGKKGRGRGRRARPDRPERRPIPIEEKAARGIEVAGHILGLIGLPDIAVAARTEDEHVVVSLGNEDTDGPLPLDSRTLESLQFVLNKAINRHADKRTRLNVEAPGFRRRRAEGFEDIAGRLAEKTRKLGKVITLGPLGHNEYRGFSAQLGKAEGVTVGSVGGHDRRRLVIAPEGVDISGIVDGGSRGGGGGGRRRRRRRRSKG